MELNLRGLADKLRKFADVIAEKVLGVSTDFGERFRLEVVRFITCAALHGKMKRKTLAALSRETIGADCTADNIRRLYVALKKLRQIASDLLCLIIFPLHSASDTCTSPMLQLYYYGVAQYVMEWKM